MSEDPRWSDDPRDRQDDKWRDRHDQDTLTLGRGPSSTGQRDEHADDNPRRDHDHGQAFDRDRNPRDHDHGFDPRDMSIRDLDPPRGHDREIADATRDRHAERWPERDHDARHRDGDPRDGFMQRVSLPRGPDREIVHDASGREYTLRGSETRTLSTVGAFRVVPARDLRDHSGRVADPRDGELRHLREQGLIQTVRLPGHRDLAVVLTERGRDVLESNRDHHQDGRQEFYAGLKREREAEHDAQIYEAYLSVADRVLEDGGHIERVVLDCELKREYQKWLHERDGDRDDYDGHPDRKQQEIEEGAGA